MRSRTIGPAIAASLSSRIDVPEKQLLVHSDQYRKYRFDIVLTTIAKAFYETASKAY